jgi:tRNA (adenine57-N1/adenine58-N1)-methyltransferase catalytic subunit
MSPDIPIPKSQTEPATEPHLANYGDTVLLAGKDRKQFVRALTPGAEFTSHLGKILHDDVVGKPFGSPIKTHLGNLFYLLIPQIPDLIAHARHETAIIQAKDLGYIALKLGVHPGAKIAEAGTGSGALTLMLASLVGESGHVYSFERKAGMIEVALRNLKRAGLTERVTLTIRDITEGFGISGMDGLFLDVPTPWDYLPQARSTLIDGGMFGALVPTINQLIQLVEALYSGAWFMVEVEELLLRKYKITEARIRPDDEMVGHTGYLIFARAVRRDKVIGTFSTEPGKP